jgi:predicted  nucleic acid-binding Zn-ribbon protein|tara:strand:+ start:3900 stop:4214 length:315 start_codon:yes stop_codon:yes gene_type:complete
MSETSGLKFKTAYDEAKANIASSLDAVKITYENINRDLADEIKGLDKEKKDLTASLTKAKKDIEGLQNNIKTLETSLGASKDLVASTQQTLEVRIALFFASPYI